jgi:hypothetical protein
LRDEEVAGVHGVERAAEKSNSCVACHRAMIILRSL